MLAFSSRLLLSAGIMALMATAFFSVSAESRDTKWSFPVNINSIELAAVYNGSTLRLVKTGSYGWGREYSARTSSGAEVATVELHSDGGEMVMKLVAKRRGSFNYSATFLGTKAKFLDHDLSWVQSSKIFKYYPYNWNIKQSSIARPDLITPGALLDNNIIAHKDASLYRLEGGKRGNKYYFTFPKQREIGSGWDKSTLNIPLNVNQESTLRLVVAKNIKSLQRERFDSVRYNRVSGTITQVAYSGWGSTFDGHYLPVKTTKAIAADLKDGGFQHVIVRLNEPRAEEAKIYRDAGLNPHYYIFLGASRLRQSTGGSTCYSLMLVSGGRCITTWTAKKMNGDVFTMPINSAWALVDVRNDDYRQQLVNRAVQAVKNGYTGIFFDGPQLFADAYGRVGGRNNRNYNLSWYHARALLLEEVKNEIHKVNKDAVVGILGNEYTDFQGMADYVVPEVSRVIAYTANPRNRRFGYESSYLDKTAALSKWYAPDVMLALKGNNIKNVNQMYIWAKQKGITWSGKYIGFGDFREGWAGTWSDLVRAMNEGIPN